MITVDISNYTGRYAHLNQDSRALTITRLTLARCVMMAGQSGLRDLAGLGFYRFGTLLCLALGNTSFENGNLRISDKFRRLEATEKGCVSYHLGMGLAKFCMEELLDVGWLTHLSHLDSARVRVGRARPPKLNLYTCRKKPGPPDLIGFTRSRESHVVEAKGYSSGFVQSEFQHAINQVSQVTTIDGNQPETRNVCYFDLSTTPIRGRIVDPPQAEDDEGTRIELTFDSFLQAYYEPFRQTDLWPMPGSDYVVNGRSFQVWPLGAPNLLFGLESAVFRAVLEGVSVEKAALAFQSENLPLLESSRGEGISIGRDGVILVDQRIHLKKPTAKRRSEKPKR